MFLIVDGYNLLHATGILGAGTGTGSLQRSRQALLNFLAATLDPQQVRRTTVVFDAKRAPPGLPRQVDHRGLTVHYASQHEDADALIEELIRKHAAPGQLLVVSSDHRLQRAAQRRRAKATDSDVWYHDLLRDKSRREASSPAEAKPTLPLSRAEVEFWLDHFSNSATGLEDETELRGPPADQLASDINLQNPFPPGYAEDLLDDEDR